LPIFNKIKDTVINNLRTISMVIKPQRKVNKIELIANEAVSFHNLSVQGVMVDKKENEDTYKFASGTILSYYFATLDTDLTIDLTFDAHSTPNISLIEASFDLLTNPLFEITPRTKEMMPMPFVTNDAVITMQQLKL